MSQRNKLTCNARFFFQLTSCTMQGVFFLTVYFPCRNFQEYLIRRIPILAYENNLSFRRNRQDGASPFVAYYFSRRSLICIVNTYCILGQMQYVSLKNILTVYHFFRTDTHVSPPLQYKKGTTLLLYSRVPLSANLFTCTADAARPHSRRGVFIGC